MKSKLNEERRKAAPEASDLQSPKEVWKNGEVEPSNTELPPPQTGPLGRVADAGNVGAGSASVYGTEVQAEVVGTYTRDDAEPRKTEAEKPLKKDSLP